MRVRVRQTRDSLSERRLLGIFTAHLLGLTLLAVVLLGSLTVNFRGVDRPLPARLLLAVVWAVWTVTGLCALAIFPRWRARLMWLGLWGSMVLSAWIIGLGMMEVTFDRFDLDNLTEAILPSAVCAGMAFAWIGVLGQRWNMRGQPTGRRRFAMRTMVVVVGIVSFITAFSVSSETVGRLLETRWTVMVACAFQACMITAQGQSVVGRLSLTAVSLALAPLGALLHADGPDTLAEVASEAAVVFFQCSIHAAIVWATVFSIRRWL